MATDESGPVIMRRVFVLCILFFCLGAEANGQFRPGYTPYLSDKSLSCPYMHRAEILGAHFPEDKRDRTICTDDCKPTAKADSSSQCLWQRFSRTCLQRLSRNDLRHVYGACEFNPSYCDLSKVNISALSVSSSFEVEYYCVPESETVKPYHPGREKESQTSYILLENDAACNSTCKISSLNPSETFVFIYRFLPTDPRQTVSENVVGYRRLPKKDDQNSGGWQALDSSFYTGLHSDVEALEIRFQIPERNNIEHLWMAFLFANVSIACTATSPGGSSVGTDQALPPKPSTRTTLTTSTTTTTKTTTKTSPETTAETIAETTTYSSHTGEEAGLSLTATNTLVIGLVVGIVAACIVFVVFCICKKKQGKPLGRPQPRRNLEVAVFRRMNPTKTREASSEIYAEINDDPMGKVDADSHTRAHRANRPLIPIPGQPTNKFPANQSNDYLHVLPPPTYSSPNQSANRMSPQAPPIEKNGTMRVTQDPKQMEDFDGYMVPKTI